MSEPEYVMPEEEDLTPRQQRFVREYLQDMTATHAAVRAGYAGGHAAGRLMSSYQVRSAILAELKAQMDRIGFCADDIVRALCHIAFGDRRNLFANDHLKPPSQWTKAEADQVSSFTVTSRSYPDGTVDTATRVHLSDRMKALELLAKRVWPEFNQQLPVDVSMVQSIIDEQQPDQRVVVYLPHNNRDPLPPGRWVERELPEEA